MSLFAHRSARSQARIWESSSGAPKEWGITEAGTTEAMILESEKAAKNLGLTSKPGALVESSNRTILLR